MIVIDASLLVESALCDPADGRAVTTLLERDEQLFAPAHVTLEVMSALRRLESSGRIQPVEAQLALDVLLAVPIARYDPALFARRIWELRRNMTPYDAAYVALAEGLDVPLVTCDRRLASAPGHAATVRYVGA